MVTALIGMDMNELRALASQEGEPSYRGNQLAEAIYRHGASSFEEMTILPGALRVHLAERYVVGRAAVVSQQNSNDGTVKLLLKMEDGSLVETVGLPYDDRYSCCLSSQVGCPVGCVFCATGLSGFGRNLTAGEIVGELLAVRQAPANNNPHSRVDHVAFMGMGEPLMNYEATLKAVHLLNDEVGIAARHITISTVGFVPGIHQLAGEKLQVTLAVSLHAPNDKLRQKLVPGITKWGIREILDACRHYVRETHRRVTIEYCLLGGINDGANEARELNKVLWGLNCHVNLIPYNPISGSDFYHPSPKVTATFEEILREAGIEVTQRLRRGQDIDAACGQLRRRVIKETSTIEGQTK